jgi:hypothetical protein
MKKIFTVICAFIVVAGCGKSIFVPDPTNNLLPEYSESGRNIAGALVNDSAWRCVMHSCIGCIFWKFFISSSLSGDSTVFSFHGYYTPNSIQFIDSAYNLPFDIYFVVKGLKIENQDSLFKLNNKTFQLDGNNSYSSISKEYGVSPTLDKGPGTFTINRVQEDKHVVFAGTGNAPNAYRFIVSGHFNCQVTADRPYAINDGRFDMEVYLNTDFFVGN